MFLKLVS